VNYICWTRPNSICWSVLREIRAHGSDRDFWSLEIVYGRNFGHHCLRIRASNIKCSWPHYKFTLTFQMSVQFLEARACHTLHRDPPNLGNFISRVRRKNDPQYFYTLRRKSWCICTQALNKYYNKHSRLIKNATEPWLLLHSNEKCRTSCYCRHCIQFPLIRFSFGWTVWESLNDCVWIRGLASSK